MLWTFLRFAPYVASVLLLFVGLILYAGSWFLPGLAVPLRTVWIACGVCFGVFLVAQVLFEIAFFRDAGRRQEHNERD